jgi:radical SAM-linked protein
LKRDTSVATGIHQGRQMTWSTRIQARVFKLGEARFLSHLEMITAFHRAARRAHLPLAYSRGFHPLPKIRFEGALSLGMESLAELAEFELIEPMGTDVFMEKLNGELPDGLAVSALEGRSHSLGEQREAHWCVLGFSDLSGFQQKIDAFLEMDHLIHTQKRKRGMGEIDLRSTVDKVRLRDTIPLPAVDTSFLPPSFRELQNHGGGVIEFVLRGEDGRRPRPREVMSRLFDLTEDEIKGLRFIKLAET